MLATDSLRYEEGLGLRPQDLTPMDMYFFRPGTYTIQMVFRFDRALDYTVVRKALDELLIMMPLIGSKLELIGQRVRLLPGQFRIPLDLSFRGDAHFEEIKGRDGQANIENELINQVENWLDEPLVKLKITNFKGGSTLGVSFSHILGDGFSLIGFLKNLSYIINRKGPYVDMNFQRESLHQLVEQQLQEFDHVQFYRNTGYIFPRVETPPGPIEEIIVGRDDINQYKSTAIGQGGEELSAHSIIMAILVKRYGDKIPLNSNGNLVVRCPVDYRKRHKMIPDNYFGNAVTDAFFELNPNEVKESSVVDIARLVMASISHIDEKRIEASLTNLNSYQREYGCNSFQRLSCPGLLVTNFVHFPFESLNFGAGSVREFIHASMNPRLAVILKKGKDYKVRIKLPGEVRF